MRRSNFHYFPLALPFILIFLLLLLFVFTLLQIRVLEYAYEKIGLNPQYIFSLLFLSLMGSCVNIPVAKLPAKQVLSGQEITFFGIRYIIPPVQKRTRTVIAVNVGGAVIPALLPLYLLVNNGLYIQSFLGVAIVTVIVTLDGQSCQGGGDCRADFHSSRSRRWRGALAFTGVCPCPGLYCRDYGNLDGCGSPEPWQNPGARRPCRLHRRSRDL